VTVERELPRSITWNFNDGDMVTTVEVAPGCVGGGWGVRRVEVTSSTPIHPDFLAQFLDSTTAMILSGGTVELINEHNAENPDDWGGA
jgi:hypothetical protein